MDLKDKAPRLCGRQEDGGESTNSAGVWALLRAYDVTPDNVNEVVRDMGSKERALVMVLLSLLEHYLTRYNQTLEDFKTALEYNGKLREWAEARLPGKEDLV